MDYGKVTFHAYQLKILYSTEDPRIIAERSGAIVRPTENISPKVLKARTIYIGRQAYIEINPEYDETSQMFLCSHELGHFFYQPGEAHEYKSNYSGYFDLGAEYIANMFAAALMFPRNVLSMPIAYMDPVSLQLLIDKNVHLKNK